MNDLFPFFIRFNRKMAIVSLGKSVTKLGITVTGGDFFDQLDIERPLQVHGFEDVLKNTRSLFIVRVRKSGIKMRGQMYFDAPSDSLAFLGSPLVQSFEDLKGTELSLNDFAIHDNINQFLFTTQMLNSSLADSKKIELRLQQVNQDLRQKNTELEDMAHVLSHDLKSPIRGILTLAEFIEGDIAEQDYWAVPQHIATIKGRAERMYHLIEGVFAFSKIGIEKAEAEPVDLNTVVADVLADNRDALTDRTIEAAIRNSLPTVTGVRVLLVQLFSNLIGNAVRHNDKSEIRIAVDCREFDDAYEISVADNGPGIEQRYHGKIFEIFQTLSVDEKNQTTGVGLSIVKKIVGLLKGSVRLESEMGAGTTFFVTLPKR